VHEAGGRIDLAISSQDHDARSLVEPTGFRKEGGGLGELPAKLRGARLREAARPA
jgi:hypothetical protein